MSTPEQPPLRERSPDLYAALRSNIGSRVHGIARHVGVQAADLDRLLDDIASNPNGRHLVTVAEHASLVTALTLLRTAEHVLATGTTDLQEQQP